MIPSQKKKSKRLAPKYSAPAIWQAAMAPAVIPEDNFDKRKKEKATKGLLPMRGAIKTWKDKVQRIIDEDIQARIRQGQGADFDPDDEAELVQITPDGYLIYKMKKRKTYGVAGVPPVYRIKRLELSESAKACRSGRNICMCRAVGTCPLLAYKHDAPCNYCTDPMLMTYYPTDSQWWELRHQVKEFRKLTDIEDETV